jgi:hypothetical protein
VGQNLNGIDGDGVMERIKARKRDIVVGSCEFFVNQPQITRLIPR